MLISYTVSNFKSIGETPVTVSFEATKYKTVTENQNLVMMPDMPPLTKGCFIFGNNGSGKTSIISSIKRLVAVLRHSMGLGSSGLERRTSLKNMNHRLFMDKPSSYHIVFVKEVAQDENDIQLCKFDYVLEIDGSTITRESLYYSPNGRSTEIFTRNGESFSFGSKFELQASNCNDGFIRPYRSLLGIAASVTKIPAITAAFRFFMDDIDIYDSERSSRFFSYHLSEAILEQPDLKSTILDILKETDFDIEDIILEEQETEPGPRLFRSQDEDEDYFFEERERTPRKTYRMLLKHPQLTLPISAESSGTKNLFHMIASLIDVMNNKYGKLIVFDEPETSMHPNLVKSIVSVFMSEQHNKYSQMLCTTHATELLNLDLLRSDQIYFTSLENENRTTKITRLTENGIRTTDKIERNFLGGIYTPKA